MSGNFVLRSDLPVELIQSVGDDATIVQAARVSTGTDRVGPFHPEQDKADAGLIRYLMRNRHGSPFEHGSMTFRIEAPIFVAREFMRHRVGWSYNEESGRYKVLDGEFYLPAPGRSLVQTGKPGHYDFTMGTPEQYEMLTDTFESAYGVAWHDYNEMLDAGIAKEVARMVLPVGTYTSWYATCNPRSAMHFLSLRTKDGSATFPSYPMREIEVVARGIESHFKALYPVTYEAWDASGRVAP